MTLPIVPVADRTALDAVYAEAHKNDSKFNKGALNYTDLNRIETNCRYICEQLVGYGYSVQFVTKTDWTALDFPTQGQIDRIRQNVLTLREKYYILQGSPDVRFWDSLDWQDTNSLEQNLTNLDELLRRMIDGFRWCGTFACGQDFAF